MRELVEAFYRERSIVNHHIASFNDFLPTIDNPNSRMQRIVDNLRSSPEDDRRGVFKLDEDRTEGDVIENRIEREPERVHIGNLPIMVKAKKCSLYKENLEIEGELTEPEYRQKLIEVGEDPCDPGGYFIIGGTERALISLEDLAPNRVLVEYNER